MPMRHAKPRKHHLVLLFSCLLVAGALIILTNNSWTDKILGLFQSETVLPVSKATALTQLIDAPSADDYASLQKTVVTEGATEWDQKISETGFIGSALLIKNGRILLNKGYGLADAQTQQPNTPQSHYQIGSIQKSFTGSLIMQAIAAGKLTFHTALSDFYPELPAAETITIRNLLEMTSGLRLPTIPDFVTTDSDLIAFVKTHTTLKNQGHYFYSPVNFIILAGILEQLYQTDYQTLFQKAYQQQLGLTSTGFYKNWPKDPLRTHSYKQAEGDPYAEEINETPTSFAHELGTGNVSMDIRDLYWYFHQLLAGQVVDKKVLANLWAANNEPAYRSGSYIYPDHIRAHGSEQGQRAMVLLTPDAKSGVILLTNSNQPEPYTQLITHLFDGITGTNAAF